MADGRYDVVLVDRFRTWPTEAEAFQGHTEFITKKYPQVWAKYQSERTGDVAHDVARFVYALQHLSWLQAEQRWLRYSTDDTYEKKIADMALSAAVTEALK
jgi:hypothetical protein